MKPIKPSRIVISVPKPCEEDWDKMLPDEKGRFCLSCSKTVVDFTKNTKDEIISFFKEARGRVCGRFRNDQLNQVEIPGPQLRRVRVFACALYLVFGSMLFSCSRAPKQVDHDKEELVEGKANYEEMPPVPGMADVFWQEEDEIQEMINQLEVQNARKLEEEKHKHEERTMGFIPPQIIDIPDQSGGSEMLDNVSEPGNPEVLKTGESEIEDIN